MEKEIIGYGDNGLFVIVRLAPHAYAIVGTGANANITIENRWVRFISHVGIIFDKPPKIVQDAIFAMLDDMKDLEKEIKRAENEWEKEPADMKEWHTEIMEEAIAMWVNCPESRRKEAAERGKKIWEKYLKKYNGGNLLRGKI